MPQPYGGEGRTAVAHDPGANVLVAEESHAPAASAYAILKTSGVSVAGVTDGTAALTSLRTASPSLIVTEVRWSRGSGFHILEEARRLHRRTPVVLFTGQPSVGEAVRAMQEGAESYLGKPLGGELLRAVERGLARRHDGAGSDLPRGAAHPGQRKGLVGDSRAMRDLLSQIDLVGPTRTTVLLLGETGTGKERLAQALHDASPRRNDPFVAVNCSALTETLLESELFGHEKGSFSGAHTRREGRFKIAHGGTIFLDEIGEISAAVQVKLLRVLQERQFERVGGNETLPVDVRVIAATNRNLRAMVESRAFRADLYYRLNVVALDVPPLRARKEDIPPLVAHIIPRLALELGMDEPTVTPDGMEILVGYDWPGNVRELENVLERALVLSGGNAISDRVLSRELLCEATPVADRTSPPVPGSTFAAIERHAIITTYEACGRSPQRTAAILGLSPRTIHYRLREYGGKPGRRTREADCTPCATGLQTVR